VEKPRILLVPEFTELEWAIRPQLEEWAEVAVYDGPGVGEEVSEDELERLASDPGHRRTLTARRGLEEVERRGWERFVVVGDSTSNISACAIANERPDAVAGLALGHAALDLEGGEGGAINGEIRAALEHLVDQDREQFVQHAITQLTGANYDEKLSGEMVERVPLRLLAGGWMQAGGPTVGEMLAEVERPLLFVEHSGCLMYTPEGFARAASAVPGARTHSIPDKPSVSDEFAGLLREFCEGLPH
jgi:hypothetical protein